MKKNTGAYGRILQKIKSLGAFLIILILLPYVITVFIHGADREETGDDERYVKVEVIEKTSEKEERGEQEKEVREVPWEEYFLGVLALEVPQESETEMLKAQAVLLRTKLEQQLKEGEDTVLRERYLSKEELRKQWIGEEYEKRYTALENAMRETENQVLFYGESYAWTPFHKSSNGMTRNAKEVVGVEEYPYLAVHECPADKEAESEMKVNSFTYQEVQTRCQPFLVAVSEEDSKKVYGAEDFEILSLDTAGYVKELRIGDTICSGDEFRDALSLDSSAFSLQDSNGKLKITTTGVGHGLGMSQWTANAMAKEGSSYEEILQFFFEGTELTNGENLQSE